MPRTRCSCHPPTRTVQAKSPRLALALQYASRSRPLPSRRQLLRFAGAALAGVRRAKVELGVRIVDRAESAALNGRYRGKPCATNVLAFPLPDSHLSSCFIGDLVICAPVARAEAAAQGKPLVAHWAHLVVHGIMHLRGYDHLSDHEAHVMEAREAAVLAGLGFPNPYTFG